MLFACNNQTANNNDAAKKEQLENDNVKFYDHVWDVVINKGNVNFLDTAYAADIVLHTVPEIKGKVKGVNTKSCIPEPTLKLARSL